MRLVLPELVENISASSCLQFYTVHMLAMDVPVTHHLFTRCCQPPAALFQTCFW